MAIKLTNAHIMNPHFMHNLRNLATLRLDVSQTWNIAKIIRAVEKNQPMIEKVRLDLIKRHAVLDDNGMPKIENNNFVIKSECKEEFEKDIKELYDIEVLINANPIKISKMKLLNAQEGTSNQYMLTAQEIIILEDIFDQEDLRKEVEDNG